MDGTGDRADRQLVMQFMTTLSSAIIALALVAQVSALGRAFETFAPTAADPTGPDRPS